MNLSPLPLSGFLGPTRLYCCDSTAFQLIVPDQQLWQTGDPPLPPPQNWWVAAMNGPYTQPPTNGDVVYQQLYNDLSLDRFWYVTLAMTVSGQSGVVGSETIRIILPRSGGTYVLTVPVEAHVFAGVSSINTLLRLNAPFQLLANDTLRIQFVSFQPKPGVVGTRADRLSIGNYKALPI